MNYCKITADKQAMLLPNPFSYRVANPNETQKALIAQLDSWLEMVYTEAPSYNPETEYLVETWEEENGKAVQHWEVKPIEEPVSEE